VELAVAHVVMLVAACAGIVALTRWALRTRGGIAL
jgi:hypothetical protein